MNLELMKQSQIRCKRRAYDRHILKLKEKFVYRDTLDLLRFSNRSGSHINCFRFNLSEDIRHIHKKLDICIELMNKNHKFICEGIFENGCRCDVIDLSDSIIYEILNTEDEKKFNEKIRNYPVGVEVVKVNVQTID